MSQETFELVCDLLSRASVTPDDAGCQKKLAEILQPEGFSLMEINRGQTKNAWLRKGTRAPLFVFAGHTDVVPPGNLDLWTTPPFSPTVRDRKIYARGASDMKASDAAFAIAAKRFVRDFPDHKGSIALLITSDEEGDGLDGTVYAVEKLRELGVKPDWCVVGEPSSSSSFGDTVKVGRRGSLNGKLRVKGVQGHVAYPEKVVNPIHLAGKIVSELSSHQFGEEFPNFPLTSFQVSNIHGGTGAVNVVPAECEVTFNVRYNPSLTPQELMKEIEKIIARTAPDFEIEWKVSALPFATDGKDLRQTFSKAIREVCGREPVFSTSGGTSDGRFIAGWCPDVVEFGPTNATIHKINENVSLDELHRLEEVYYRVLKALLT